MDETLQEKIELGMKVTQKMISEMEVNLQDAIEKERWIRAAELDAYLRGMRQIQIVISQAISRK